MEEVLSQDLGKFVLPSSQLSLIGELIFVFIATDVLYKITEQRTEKGEENTLYKYLVSFYSSDTLWQCQCVCLDSQQHRCSGCLVYVWYTVSALSLVFKASFN